MNKFKKLLLSSRPASWVNTAYPFAAAYYVSEHSINWLFIIGSLYFLIPYNLLMYGINDVFDYQSDLKNPRKGGLQGAKLDKQLHRLTIYAAILLNFPFLIYLFFQGGGITKAVLVYVIFMVLAYSLPVLRFKERPFLDSFTSSTHFVGPLAYGFSFGGYHNYAIPVIAAFFLWGMASHAFGAVQDIIADRQANIKSVATIIGAQKTVWLSLALYLLSVVPLIGIHRLFLVWTPIAALYILNILPFRRVSDKNAEATNSGWKRFMKLNYLSGFVITMIFIKVLYVKG